MFLALLIAASEFRVSNNWTSSLRQLNSSLTFGIHSKSILLHFYQNRFADIHIALISERVYWTRFQNAYTFNIFLSSPTRTCNSSPMQLQITDYHAFLLSCWISLWVEVFVTNKTTCTATVPALISLYKRGLGEIPSPETSRRIFCSWIFFCQTHADVALRFSLVIRKWREKKCSEEQWHAARF